MNFQKDVIEDSHQSKVVVDFSASWCGPCKMAKPVLQSVFGQRDDYKLVIIDVDGNQDIARQYGVRSVPTILMFDKGTPISKYAAPMSPSILNDWLNHFATQ